MHLTINQTPDHIATLRIVDGMLEYNPTDKISEEMGAKLGQALGEIETAYSDLTLQILDTIEAEPAYYEHQLTTAH